MFLNNFDSQRALMLVMTTIFISKMEGLPPTSNIRMIDIWLVLCQMVPFAEVVLLTAMEYCRKDDVQEIHLVQMTAKDIEEDSLEKKERIKCWTPNLKTLGETFSFVCLFNLF